MNEKKVFIPYPYPWIIRYNLLDMAQTELGKWCEKNIDYPLEFGYTNGRIMGVYLKPEDAVACILAIRKLT